ncbi:MAG: hypothetical protein EOM83_06600 [Clostridia bacterium]|nr:hypothetical protein [Clostridia bacterium]
MWKLFQETDRQFQKTDRQFQETKKQIMENDRMLTEKFKETDKKIKELSALFTTQWGILVETLADGDLIKLLKDKNIHMQRTMQNARGTSGGQKYGYDLIADNLHEAVIVEVKTTLRAEDVREFHQKIWKAKTYLSQYKDSIIYGCMAFLKAEEASDRMAEKLGFFVIKATGSSASIINRDDFVPKAF